MAGRPAGLGQKGSASLQLTTGDAFQYRVRYRRPFGTDWEDRFGVTRFGVFDDTILGTAVVLPAGCSDGMAG